MNILIADSGSTKTDWSLIDGQGQVVMTCKTQGINPIHMQDAEVLQILKSELILPESPQEVYFYGSGVTEAMKPRMNSLLQQAFPGAKVEAEGDMMYHCQGKIIVTGVGKSGHVGAKIAATLASTGTPAFYINPLDVYHGDLGVMTDKDVVLALSNSGQTDELLRFIPMVLHMNVPIISITGNPNSLLAKYSNHHITVKVKKEACPLNLAPTSSTTAALAMGDALVIALMQVRHFKPRDFAQFHPGGELGKRLLTTAEDVMRSEDMPIIPKEMHLGEAIIHVSKGKLGLGISLDEDQRVIGLITDGDIRRAMEKWQAEFFNKTVSDIMTTTPKMVTPKILMLFGRKHWMRLARLI
jgi:arabinose-5-phosphate isomerase